MSSISRQNNKVNAQQDCLLFLLSKEIRSEIYKLAFETPNDLTGSTSIDITRAVELAPSNALMATCYRIWIESAVPYATVRREYWRSNSFVVHMAPIDTKTTTAASTTNGENPAPVPNQAITNLGPTPVQLLSSLTIKITCPDYTHTFTLGAHPNPFVGLLFLSENHTWSAASRAQNPPRALRQRELQEKLCLGYAMMASSKSLPKALIDVGRAARYVGLVRRHLAFVERGRGLNSNEMGLRARCEGVVEIFGQRAEREAAGVKRSLVVGVVGDFGVRHGVEVVRGE